jgi:hypothetical protein
MRYLRYLLLGFAALLLLAGVSLAILTIYFRQSIARLVVSQIEAQAGIQLLSANTRIEFTPRLTLQFEQVEVRDQQQSLAHLKSLELSFSYRVLLNRTGLPLYRIVLDHPTFHLPPSIQQPVAPRLDAAAAQLIEESLATLSHLTRHLDILGATVLAADDQPLLADVNVQAYRRLLLGTRWRFNFNAAWLGSPLKQTQLSGTFNLGARSATPGTPVAQAELWFWNVSLDRFPVAPGLETRGRLQGDLALTLHEDGTALAETELKIAAAGFAGQRLLSATTPVDLTLDAVVNSAPEQIDLQKIELWQGRRILLAGDGSLTQPSGPTPNLALRLGGFTLTAPDVQKIVASIRNPPGAIVAQAANLKSGELRVNQVSINSPLDGLKSDPIRIAKRLNLDSTLQGVSLALPPDLKLPPIDKLEATLLIRQSVMTINQGSATMGNSHLTSLDARADLSRGLGNVSYRTTLSGDVDLGQLYSQSTLLNTAIPAAARAQLTRLDGSAGFDAEASGKSSFSGSAFTPPSDYRLSLQPRVITVALKVGGPAFKIVSGKAQLTPNLISFDRITATPPSGKIVVSGSAKSQSSGFTLDSLRATIEQLPAQQWLPLAINPGDLAAEGPVSGNLTLDGNGTLPAASRINGNLRLIEGQIRFGFLRSPVETPLGSLKLAGGGAQLSLPGSRLEGSRLDLTLGVADLQKPRMRIDAWAENLDLESMKFIRMPWTPKSPAMFFGKSHAFGHVETHQSRLERLAIRDLKFDFTRDGGAWRVFNCTGRIFDGGITMDLLGRDPDDWVHIKSRLSNVNLGPLLSMSDPAAKPAIVGKLDADADLWADTDGNFFETIGGTLWFQATRGTLLKFKLLSRILSLIDLSHWLTARIPDPTVAGLPFDSLKATFAGKDGLFYTQDLLLTGPAMTISAAGNLNLAKSTMDMQLGLRPFSTVEKVVTAIPLLGRGLADDKSSILAAYFHARGPIRDPSVTVAPVTSIAEIIKRTLGLPINIIRPNTIK